LAEAKGAQSEVTVLLERQHKRIDGSQKNTQYIVELQKNSRRLAEGTAKIFRRAAAGKTAYAKIVQKYS
jgi:hypothetical protein